MVVIGLLVWPVGVSKNTKKDRTQKVTENVSYCSNELSRAGCLAPYPHSVCPLLALVDTRVAESDSGL